MTVPTGEMYAEDGNGHLTMNIGELHMLAKHTIGDKIDALVDALDTIGTKLDQLEVSWAGDAKNEAQQLLDRWADVSDGIFGTKKNPEKGVLARLAGGVQNAAFSYNQSETVVRESWAKLVGDLTTIADGGQPSTDDTGGNAKTPPISEV